MSTAARRADRLTTEETVSVARTLIESEGLDRFSMRKLAAALGVNPMTIYLRFENKEALLGAVARESLDAIELPARSGPWVEQATALARALHDRLLADPGTAAALVHVGADLPRTVLRLADHGLTLMRAVGYADEDAVDAFRALFWHTVGFALADDAMRTISPDRTADALVAAPADDLPTYRALRSHFGAIDPETLFLLTTRRLVEGIAAAAPAPPADAEPS
jgi:AcrR family transcriptional regulator